MWNGHSGEMLWEYYVIIAQN